MKLSVHLVTWNGAKYIPYLFDSLRKQTFLDWKLVILDNNSSDTTVELINQELNNFGIQHEFIINPENTGFAGGHNQLFKNCHAEYFLLLNQDMYLEPDCLEKLVKFLDEHPDAVAVSPRLMRWLFSQVEAGKLEESFSTFVDTLGLKVLRNRRVVDAHTQESWPLASPNHLITLSPNHPITRLTMDSDEVTRCSGDQVFESFGISGALPMFRKSAIDQIKFDDGNFFDPLYHLYKEDVDLAFRLQSAGFKAFVVLDAVAFHDRSGAGPLEDNDAAARENKVKQSDFVRYHSYKNHLMTLYKNEYWQNFVLDLPWILWYEMKKFGYFLLFDRTVLKGLGEIWKNKSKVKSQKSKVRSLRKVGWREMRKWWKNG